MSSWSSLCALSWLIFTQFSLPWYQLNILLCLHILINWKTGSNMKQYLVLSLGFNSRIGRGTLLCMVFLCMRGFPTSVLVSSYSLIAHNDPRSKCECASLLVPMMDWGFYIWSSEHFLVLRVFYLLFYVLLFYLSVLLKECIFMSWVFLSFLHPPYTDHFDTTSPECTPPFTQCYLG